MERKQIVFRRAVSRAFFLISLVFFAACRNEPKGANTATADRPSGNNVVVRLTGEPERLNPLTTEEANAIQVMNQIFLPLLDFDPETFALTPVLAKSRPTVATIDTGKLKGGTAYTYEIRDEAQWSNGQPVTAADVAFTIKAILNRKSGAANLRSTIDFVKNVVVDPSNPKKITILSDRRYISAEANVGTLSILPESVYDTEGSLKNFSVADILQNDSAKVGAAMSKFANALQSPKFSREAAGIVGSGAYTLAEWRPSERLVLQKKPNWWGDKLAAATPILSALPERLTFKIVPDEAAALALVKDGQFDAATKVSPKAFLEMQKDDKMKAIYNFSTAPALSLGIIGFNCKSPLLNDKRTRRALAHLLDVEGLTKTILSGFAEPCAGPFVPQKSYYDKSLKTIDLNLETAKKLLAEAGWKNTNGDSTLDKRINGKATELVLRFVVPSANAMGEKIGLTLQENAKKVGVKIEIVKVEGKSFVGENLRKRDFDLFINNLGMNPGLDDPKELWATSSNTPDGGNRFQFENKAADALIEQIRSELDATKRDVLYKKFQNLIYDEQPAIFLFAPKDRIVISQRFAAKAVARRPGYVLGQFKLK